MLQLATTTTQQRAVHPDLSAMGFLPVIIHVTTKTDDEIPTESNTPSSSSHSSVVLPMKNLYANSYIFSQNQNDRPTQRTTRMSGGNNLSGERWFGFPYPELRIPRLRFSYTSIPCRCCYHQCYISSPLHPNVRRTRNLSARGK